MKTVRGHSSGAFVNHFMVYALVAICSAASVGLGTVWMRYQISVTANANKVLEAQIADVQRQMEETNALIAAEQDPGVLNKRNAEWNLGLVPPAETQQRQVAEDPMQRLAAIHNRDLFGDRPATVTLNLASGH